MDIKWPGVDLSLKLTISAYLKNEVQQLQEELLKQKVQLQPKFSNPWVKEFQINGTTDTEVFELAFWRARLCPTELDFDDVTISLVQLVVSWS